MFIASFSQVNSAKFTPNQHGQMPYIGDVKAGVATATLIDATIFENGKYLPNTLYLCENNVRVAKGRDGIDREYAGVSIIGVITTLEYVSLRAQLGAPRLVVSEPKIVDANTKPAVIVNADMSAAAQQAANAAPALNEQPENANANAAPSLGEG